MLLNAQCVNGDESSGGKAAVGRGAVVRGDDLAEEAAAMRRRLGCGGGEAAGCRSGLRAVLPHGVCAMEDPADEMKRKSRSAKRGSGNKGSGIMGLHSVKSLGLLICLLAINELAVSC